MEKKMVINGMKCMHCKATVEKALKEVPGVSDAEVDLDEKTATITLEKKISDDVLLEKVREKGFEPVRIV
jgi:copper chaperone CopZ